MIPLRRTLRSPASFAGAGLFTVARGSVRVMPADPGSGLRFVRRDLESSPAIPALPAHVFVDPRLPGRNTSLIHDASRPPARDNPAIATIEHVMSALAGLWITDAIVECDGPEIPIVDGSAAPIVEAILASGMRELGTGDKARSLDRTIVVGQAPGPTITLSPSERSRFEYRLDYAGDSLPAQEAAFTIDEPDSPGRYVSDVAPARTFCLQREALALRQAGLFAHVTPREMLVIGTDGQPLENEYRFAHEPARHKLLDLIGDLMLAGVPVRCAVRSDRGGHTLNQKAAAALRAWAVDAGR